MKTRKCTKEGFLDSVKHHYIEIVKDDGLFRHIVMSSGSFNMKYEVTTWPGHLCFSGDMGCFVFSRLSDMFAFFRNVRGELEINKQYWHEKLEAADRCDGAMKYSQELFEQAVIDAFAEFSEEDQAKRDRVWEEIREDVLSVAGDGMYPAYNAAFNFSSEGFEFTDFGENNFDEYTYRFVWCLYAVVYAIQKYDLSSSG